MTLWKKTTKKNIGIKPKMKKIFIILLSVLFVINSCGKKYDSNSEFGAYEFEKYISKLAANKDTLEFTSNFILNLDEDLIEKINQMNVIYELSPVEIIESIKSRGALYQRIFSDSEDSLCNYLPKEGGYYDVSVTYRKFKDISVAQIEYPSFNEISKNSMEFVAIYLNDKWNLITINFLNI